MPDAPQGGIPERIISLSSLIFTVCKAAFGILAVTLLLWALFDARFKHSIIVEALSVPDAATSKGYTGQVVASRIVDRMTYLARVGNRAQQNEKVTAQPPDVPIKVQVSGVGISIDEAFGYLRALVSNDVAVSGELTAPQNPIRRAGGAQSVVVLLRLRVNLDGGTCESAAPEVDQAIVLAADCMYRHIQPDRFARYIANRFLETSCADGDKRCTESKVESGRNDRPFAKLIFTQAMVSPIASLDDLLWAKEGFGHQLVNDANDLTYSVQRPFDQYVEVVDRQKLDDAVKTYEEAIEDFEKTNGELPLAQSNLVDATMALVQTNVFSSNDHSDLVALRSLTTVLELDTSQHVRTQREKWRRFDFYNGLASALVGDFTGAEGWYGRAQAACTRDGGLKNGDREACSTDAGIRNEVCGQVPEDDPALKKAVHDRKCGDAGDRVLLVRALAHDAQARSELSEIGVLDYLLPADVVQHQWLDISDQCNTSDHKGLCETRDINQAALALAEAEQGHFDEAILIAPTSRQCDACLRYRGRIYALEKAWAMAGTAFWEAQSHAPDLPQSYSDWAQILVDRAYTEAAASRSPNSPSNDRRAHADRAQDLLALALSSARRAHELGPEFADVYEILGRIYLAQSHIVEAAQALDVACQKSPNWTTARFEWAAVLWMMGQHHAAIRQAAAAAAIASGLTTGKTSCGSSS